MASVDKPGKYEDILMFFKAYNMRMASDMSSLGRRVPQQERGTRRMAELLEAAEAVIAESGYDAATMTAIALRAGSSIGALYQYFPNKEAVVRALRAAYGNQMEARWTLLEEATASFSVRQLSDQLIDVIVQFIDEHPAFFPLMDAPVRYSRDQNARNRLRERIAGWFRQRKPRLTPEQAFRVANVALQIVKSMQSLYADGKAGERKELVREYKLALTTYLEARLG
jgi:AcrR family transcriptional regulator